MGKKRITVLGSTEEEQQKAKKAIKLQQKKLREGKTAKAPGLGGGQRVVDTAAESLSEYEEIQKRTALPDENESEVQKTKVQKIKIRSASYKNAKSRIEIDRFYPVSEGLKLLKDINLTKFDPSVELHINLKKGGVTTTAAMPYSAGKKRNIGIADDEFISHLESGNPDLNIDILLASPAQMPKLVKFARVLGPKGLMPNPKNGTVTADPATEAKKLAGSNNVTLKTEKSAPVIHTTVGKLSQPEKELAANIEAVISALSVSGISKVVLKSTMSPAIKLQI